MKPSLSKSHWGIVGAGALCIVSALGVWAWKSGDDSVAEGPRSTEEVEQEKPDPAVEWPAATYVGDESCSGCHAEQAQAYRGSDHDHAIEEPSPQSVLAPFAGESFAHDGTTSRFSRRGEDYIVTTLGADNASKDFRVAYTFGHYPLQQYLLDVGGGRLQALTVAWDSRPKEQGGQRFYDLYPGEILRPGDEIHWASPTQNWNFTCADCHTTGLKKNYDREKDSFSPTWGQLNVGCEACHGPASNHLSWAKGVGENQEGQPEGSRGFEVSFSVEAWQIPAGERSGMPRGGQGNVPQVETCAPCHSRRQQLREGHKPGEPFLSAYVPELLMEGLYYPDGQILDEVYVYGSFTQSRMFQAGVRCNDCHEPHSLSLRRQGNDLCNGCHSAEVFDTKAHHHHEAAGGACVDCHMPETTYMGVDPRRDHSLRIPRPDLSVTLGVPNACSSCHAKEGNEWAASKVQEWFPERREPHYGQVFARARRGNPAAGSELIRLAKDPSQLAIVRGTALMLLTGYGNPESLAALTQARSNKDALIRLGVARGSLGLPPPERLRLLLPLLDDELLGVRVEASRAAVGVPTASLSAPELVSLKKALRELEATELFYADRPDAWLRIALIKQGEGDAQAAAEALEQSLKLDPRFIPSLINLADLRRSQGDENEAVRLLREAVGIDEKNPEAWYALGLALVRQKKLNEALPLLQRATELRKDNPRLFYVYAVALAESGSLPAAVRVCQEGLSHHPHDRSLLQSLMSYAKQAGDRALASEAAARLAGVGSQVGP